MRKAVFTIITFIIIINTNNSTSNKIASIRVSNYLTLLYDDGILKHFMQIMQLLHILLFLLALTTKSEIIQLCDSCKI